MKLTKEEVIKAATYVLIEPILSLIYNDPHQWSTRPCSTCKAITSIVGRPFGCILKAKQTIKKEKIYKSVYFDGGNKTLGKASNIEEARELGWKFLPDDIKEDVGKHTIKPIEFENSWMV